MTIGVTSPRVARPGYPLFVAAIGAAFGAVLAFMPLSFTTAHAAATNDYRLAGIVAVGHDYLALLELPGGGQVLVRQGSSVAGGGRVLLLDAERLRIGLPSGVIELVLEGSGRPATVSVAAVGGVLVRSDQDHVAPDQDNLIFRTVDPKSLGVALDAAAKADDRRSKPTIETTRRLAPILDLPPNSRVVAVSDQPVTSADAAIALIERRLADNMVATLNLARPYGGPETRVYVSRAAGTPR